MYHNSFKLMTVDLEEGAGFISGYEAISIEIVDKESNACLIKLVEELKNEGIACSLFFLSRFYRNTVHIAIHIWRNIFFLK